MKRHCDIRISFMLYRCTYITSILVTGRLLRISLPEKWCLSTSPWLGALFYPGQAPYLLRILRKQYWSNRGIEAINSFYYLRYLDVALCAGSSGAARAHLIQAVGFGDLTP